MREARTPAPEPGAAELVRIRPAERRDLDAIVLIEQASFADPWSRTGFARLLADAAVYFRVAETTERDPGAILGYVVAWFVADQGEIANVAVAPRARGRGVGAVLLDAALGEAGARGAECVFLEVRESNAPARALYASRGFMQVGKRRGYYRHPTEDALVLRRERPAPGVQQP